MQSTSNWLTLAVFKKSGFFRKNHLFFQNPNFWVILLIQSTCGKFATFSHLTKQFKIFSRETHLLFKNKTIFERFEKPYSFIRLLQQNFYLLFFSKKFKVFRKPIYFMKKLKFSEPFERTANFRSNYIQSFLLNPQNCFITAKSLNVLRDLTLSVAFDSKINTSGHFQKIQGFFWKTQFFLQKTQFPKISRNLYVPFALDIKLANRFSRSRHQNG